MSSSKRRSWPTSSTFIIDIIVIPRRNEQVCNLVPPLKLVEALAHKKNIIVSNLPPLTYYAKNYHNVKVFESGNVHELADQIINLKNTNRLYKAEDLMMSSNIQSLIDTFEKEKVTRHTSNIISTPKPLNISREESIFKVLLEVNGKNTDEINKVISSYTKIAKNVNRIALTLTGMEDTDRKKLKDQAAFNFLNIDSSIDLSNWDLVLTDTREMNQNHHQVFSLENGLSVLESICEASRLSALSKILYFVSTNENNFSAGYHKRSLHLKNGFAENGIIIPLVSFTNDTFGVTNSVCFIPKSIDFLARLIKWLAPNSIIAASNFENAAPFLQLRKNIPFVFIYEMRGLWHETYAAKMKEKSKTYDLESDDFYKSSLNAELEVVSKADKVVFICSEMQAYVQNKLQQPIQNYQIVGNGFDIKSVSVRKPKANAEAGSSFVIGYFGAITYYEGIAFFLDSIRELIAQGYNIRVILLGKISIKEKWILDLSKYNFVTFEGFSNNIDQYYNQIDLFIIPRLPYSVCQNVEPLKPFDCFARKVPLLVSDCKALNRLADGGNRALVFKAGNTESLKNSLIDILKKGYPTELLDQAYRWVQEQADWTQITKDYTDFIQIDKKKIYYLYADKWIISYKWSGASINAINEMAVLSVENDVYYNDIYVNDLFSDGLFDEEAFSRRYNIEATKRSVGHSKYLSKILLPSRKYDISFYRSGESEKFIKFFESELSLPKVFSHNFVERIWTDSIVGFQTEASYHFSQKLLLSDFDDDGTLGYRDCRVIPKSSFIRYQSSVTDGEITKTTGDANHLRDQLKSRFIVGVIGTIYDGTYPDLLIETIELLREQYPEKNIQLVVYTINVLKELPDKDWIKVSNYSKHEKELALSQLDVIVNTWKSSTQMYSGSNKNIDSINYSIPLIAARTPAYEEQLGSSYPLFYEFDPNDPDRDSVTRDRFGVLLKRCFDEDFKLSVKNYLAWRRCFISKDVASYLYNYQIRELCEKRILIITQNMNVGGVQKYTKQLIESLYGCSITVLVNEIIEKDKLDALKTINRNMKVVYMENYSELFDSSFDFTFVNSFPVDRDLLSKLLSSLKSGGSRIYPILHSDIHPFTVEITNHLSLVDELITINKNIIKKIKFSCGADFSSRFHNITPALDSGANGLKYSEVKKVRSYRVAFFGRIARLKCADFLCKAFTEYVMRNDSGYTLLICGPLAHKGLDSVIAKCNKLAGRSVIELHDKEFNAQERIELFKSVDALVYTTATEGLPYTFIEANSLGLPVLSSNVGAVSSLIKDGVNGYLFNFPELNLDNLFEEKPYNKLSKVMHDNETSNIEEFIRVFKLFESDDFSLEELSFNSISLVANKFSFESMSNKFRNIVY